MSRARSLPELAGRSISTSVNARWVRTFLRWRVDVWIAAARTGWSNGSRSGLGSTSGSRRIVFGTRSSPLHSTPVSHCVTFRKQQVTQTREPRCVTTGPGEAWTGMPPTSCRLSSPELPGPADRTHRSCERYRAMGSPLARAMRCRRLVPAPSLPSGCSGTSEPRSGRPGYTRRVPVPFEEPSRKGGRERSARVKASLTDLPQSEWYKA